MLVLEVTTLPVAFRRDLLARTRAEIQTVEIEVLDPPVRASAGGLMELWRERGEYLPACVALCDTVATARKHAPDYGPGTYHLTTEFGDEVDCWEVS